jgi:hypothetical protein
MARGGPAILTYRAYSTSSSIRGKVVAGDEDAAPAPRRRPCRCRSRAEAFEI